MNRAIFAWFFVFLVKVSSTEISKELEEEFKEARCDVQCLDEVSPVSRCQTVSQCPYCSPGDLVQTETKEEFSSELELICKDVHSISLKWTSKEPLVFLVEIRTKNSSWSIVEKTACSNTTLKNLNPDTDYQARLWAISKKGALFGPLHSKWIRTYSKDHSPQAVSRAKLSELMLIGKNYKATVKWKAAEDQACVYHVLITDEEVEDIDEREINVLHEPLEIELSNLKYETNYSIAITSQTLNMDKESNKTWLYLLTPTCLETFHKNLSVCVPPVLQNLQAEEAIVDEATPVYNINVTWTKPDLLPDYYIVQIFPSLQNSSIPYLNVSGNASYVVFQEVELGIYYRVMATVYSPAGPSKSTFIYKELRVNVHVPSNHIPIIFGSLGGILVLGLLAFLFLYRRCRFKHTKRQSETMISKYYEGDNFKNKEKYAQSLDNTTTEYYMPEIENDEFYLNPDCVYVGELIGEGAFGVVHKGFLKKDDGKEVDIAIKMLKGNPSSEELRQFEQEIEIMKSVGTHPHLVSMMGCSFKSGSCGPFLVVEYCDKGDLQTYLRAVWHQMQLHAIEMRYTNTPDDKFKTENNFSNKIYELFDDTLLEPRDLLSFVRQIAMGMEYLSSLRVVHRDLAARNVLMCNNRTVKVADFGLSRDVYQDNIYMKTGAGKVPVKWMALESLTHQQYTTQSDVWSFGIVLWEIVTLGGNPYSTISAQDLLGLLRNGYRMECPKNCSQKLYEIMLSCWKEVPKDRPTFTELRQMLEELLEDEKRYVSLDVRF